MNEDNPNLNEYPSVHWFKFFNRFQEINTLPPKEWKTVHLLSYFSHRYEDHYKVKFSFKFNSNSPGKSYEIFQMRKLAQTISADPQILKDYIDWWFENKIILKKKRITSLSFLTDTNNCNEYKWKKLAMDSSQNIDRTTTLPANLTDLANQIGVDCRTYGDLAFIKRMVDSGSADLNDQVLLSKISESGFNLQSLEKVK